MPPIHFTKVGGSDTTSTFFKYYELSKVGHKYLPKHEFLRGLKDNYCSDYEDNKWLCGLIFYQVDVQFLRDKF